MCESGYHHLFLQHMWPQKHTSNVTDKYSLVIISDFKHFNEEVLMVGYYGYDLPLAGLDVLLI